jgi:hypothetical protein
MPRMPAPTVWDGKPHTRANSNIHLQARSPMLVNISGSATQVGLIFIVLRRA